MGLFIGQSLGPVPPYMLAPSIAPETDLSIPYFLRGWSKGLLWIWRTITEAYKASFFPRSNCHLPGKVIMCLLPLEFKPTCPKDSSWFLQPRLKKNRFPFSLKFGRHHHHQCLIAFRLFYTLNTTLLSCWFLLSSPLSVLPPPRSLPFFPTTFFLV